MLTPDALALLGQVHPPDLARLRSGLARLVDLTGLVDRLHDAIGVVATMAHEVADAFRRFHGLEVDAHALEERGWFRAALGVVTRQDIAEPWERLDAEHRFELSRHAK